MAELDIPATTAQLEQLRQQFAALKDAESFKSIENFLSMARAKAEALTEALKKTKEGTKAYAELTAQYDLVTKAIEAANNALGGFRAQLVEQKQEVDTFNNNLEKLSKVLGRVGTSSEPVVGALASLGETLMGTGAMALLFGNQTTANLVKPLASTQDFIGSLPKAFQNYYNAMKEGAQVSDAVRMSMLSYGKSLGEAEQPAGLAVSAIDKISKQFGISRKEAWEFVSAMKGVPGAVEMLGQTVTTTTGTLERHVQLMQVAKAAGMDSQAVNALMTASYDKFGGQAKDAAGDIATFHAAVAGTDIPMSKAISQIQTAGEPLGIFGRKITETTNIWKTFAESLKGLPVDAVGKLFTTVTQQIATMGLGTQAFVAQMSGMVHGVTALGGALRMELAMREPGGIERNLERVTQTISRMGGGRILTLEEAAQTPGAEMQFQLQRQMVGQMLGIQGGQEQSRVLQVLQGVEQGGVASIDASKELQNMMTTGQKAQDLSNTFLDTIAQNATLHTSLLKTMVDLESTPKERMRAAGRALGTEPASSKPEMVAEHIRTAGYNVGRAIEGIASQFGTSARRIRAILSRNIEDLARGVSVGRDEERRKQQLRATGKTIDVEQPERAFAPMTAEHLPTATGAPLSRSQERRERMTGVPVFRPQERRERMANTPMPFLWEREQESGPMSEPGAAPTARTPGRAPTRGGTPEPGDAEGERYTATPLEPTTVRVSVVCEKCLDKKIYEANRQGNKESKGDHY